MPLEAANQIADLVQSNPTPNDQVGQGDDHIRLIKKVLQNAFPNADRAFYLPEGFALTNADLTLGPEHAFSLIRIQTSTQDCDLNLPAAASVGSGYFVVFRKINAAFDLNLIPNGTDTINGVNAPVIYSGDEEWGIVWRINSTSWSLIRGKSGLVVGDDLEDGTIPNAKLADMAEARIKGRPAGTGTGAPGDMTGTQATAILDLFTTLKGLAPGATAAEVSDEKVLRSSGAWGFTGVPQGILVDEKAAGTAGGTATLGSWEIKTLNTIKRNVNTFISLAANAFTLPIGSYAIWWETAAYGVDGHQSRLRNVTDTTTAAAGSPGYSSNGNPNQNWSRGQVVVTLAAPKAFRIEHQVQTTQATTGYGRAANFGEVETYTRVNIWRV